MKNKQFLPKIRFNWTVTLILIMTLSTAYTLLDAFVIPRAYIVTSQSQATYTVPVIHDGEQDTDVENLNASESSKDIAISTSSDLGSITVTDPVVTDMTYSDENIGINIEKVSENGVIFFVADIQLSDVSYLQTAFAYDTYGKNITQSTSEMAEANNAIFAINGDYYGFRDTGLVIRNGRLYRDTFTDRSYNESLTIDQNGNFNIVDITKTSGTDLINDGVLQSFTFGPVLVENGQLASFEVTRNSGNTNPRTAIGQISELHYIFIVVDGRTSSSKGMTISQLAQEFLHRGATVAYNLDGGGSAEMWLNGTIVNNPTDGKKSGERKISDIFYIGY